MVVEEVIIDGNNGVDTTLARPIKDEPTTGDSVQTLETIQTSAPSFDGHNRHGNLRYAWEESGETPNPNSPATGAPTITGTAQVGETLTADTSGIADEDGLENASFAYQWLADDSEIADATGSTYTLTSDDLGKRVKVEVSFTDDAGNGESLTSAETGQVENRPNSPATVQPAISGTTQVGETLTADTSGIADTDGLNNAAFAHQWLADDSEIDGATDSTYTLTSDDEGKSVKVRVTFIDDAGNDESLTSAPTGAVARRRSRPAWRTGPRPTTGRTPSPSSCVSARKSGWATRPCGTTPSR